MFIGQLLDLLKYALLWKNSGLLPGECILLSCGYLRALASLEFVNTMVTVKVLSSFGKVVRWWADRYFISRVSGGSVDEGVQQMFTELLCCDSLLHSDVPERCRAVVLGVAAVELVPYHSSCPKRGPEVTHALLGEDIYTQRLFSSVNILGFPTCHIFTCMTFSFSLFHLYLLRIQGLHPDLHLCPFSVSWPGRIEYW